MVQEPIRHNKIDTDFTKIFAMQQGVFNRLKFLFVQVWQ